jgi:hypothetical protein
MNALSQGAGVFSNIQTSQSNQLASQQQQTQEGVGLLPQIAGTTEPDTTAMTTGADLQAGLGLTQTGVGQEKSTLNITETGVTAGNFAGLPEDVGSRDMIAEEKERARKAEELHQAELRAAEATSGGRGTKGHREANRFEGGFGNFGGAIGGVSSDRSTDRSGSDGQGGPQQ